jgi:hypothetical protein
MPRRIPLLLALTAVVLVVSGFAQTQFDTFCLGNTRIKIPTPEGFAPVSSQFPRLFDRFLSTEAADNIVLEVHVDDGLLTDLIRNEDVDLQFYTKVSAPRNSMALSEQEFAVLIGQLESQIGGFFDPRNPQLAEATKNIRRGLARHNREESAFDLKATKELGSFERLPNAFSHMVLLNVESRKGTIPLLATSSILLLNGRVVFVSTYRRLTEVMDAESLKDFARKWTAEILAANETVAKGTR